MFEKTLPVLLALTVFAPNIAADCKCATAGATETTRFGGNMRIVFVEKSPRALLRGTVRFSGGEVIGGALVEVFDHPNDLQEAKNENPQKNRVAACVTGVDGKFCFRGLPSGSYELRISKGPGINVTSVRVAIDARDGSDKPVYARLENGT